MGGINLSSYRVAFVSLGCDKNLVNTEQMMALTENAGHILVADPAEADVAVLNTCAFIDSAKEEAIAQILALDECRDRGSLRKILVAGCLPQRHGEELLSELPEVDGLLGTGSFGWIAEAIQEVMDGGCPRYFGDIDAPVEELPRIVTTPRYTAFLRIAEGCDNRCAYCVIPSLRGRYRSRAMEDILTEAEHLAAGGVKEVILIAQDVTRYGSDRYGRRRLADLLEALCRIDGFRWIRLHYLYPDQIDGTLIDTIAREEKIVKYLDIPIQHCSDRLLRAMHRRGTKAGLEMLFDMLREKIPGVALRTSIICGLPGETEEDFEELCDFLRRQKLPRAGVFAFSPQEGTEAAAMPGQVPEETALRRMELLTDIQSRVMDEWNESLLGTVTEVLCEGFDEEQKRYRGRTYADSPDIDGHVYFAAPADVPAGTFVPVRITGAADGDLLGEALP